MKVPIGFWGYLFPSYIVPRQLTLSALATVMLLVFLPSIKIKYKSGTGTNHQPGHGLRATREYWFMANFGFVNKRETGAALLSERRWRWNMGNDLKWYLLFFTAARQDWLTILWECVSLTCQSCSIMERNNTDSSVYSVEYENGNVASPISQVSALYQP